MTTMHTLPIHLHVAPPHEHAWLIESRHQTSEGVVAYVRCAGCGTRRVDLQTHAMMPPSPISAEMSPESSVRP